MAVVITSPMPNAVLKGTVTVTATYDGKNFDIATCTIDGVQVASDSATPISFQVDTTKVADGARTLTVAVRYVRPNGTKRWQKASIQVEVDNVIVPPPPPSSPEFTSNIQDGDHFTSPKDWTVAITPQADKLELWADNVKLAEKVSASSLTTTLNFADGPHQLGIAYTYGSVRTIVNGGVFANVTVDPVTPPPPPPGDGVPVPVFEHLLTQDAINRVGSQSWVICTSEKVPVGSWGGGRIRQIRTPMDSGGGGSWEWWCAYRIMFYPSWQEGVGGQSSSNPHDWHDCPGQPGWENQPWDAKYGVSPVHMRYRDGSYNVAHEPNFPNHQFPIFTGVVPKGVWHSVMVRIIFGRTDGKIPSSGHPNGGKGRTFAAWNGQWTLDTGDINNLWYASESDKFTTRLDVLEGGYWVGGGKQGQNYQYELARIGRTKAECLADKGWSDIVVYRQGGDTNEAWTGQPVISRVADGNTASFVIPP